MATLNFPSNPNPGDTYSPPGSTKVYAWNGYAWVVVTSASSVTNFTAVTVHVTSTATSIGTGTGALIVEGGASIGGDLFVGGTFYAGGGLVLTTASLNLSLNEGSDIQLVIVPPSGAIEINNTSTLQSVTGRGSTTTNVVTFANTTNATSITTGAIVVSGGVAVTKNLVVGSTATIYRDLIVNSSTYLTKVTATDIVSITSAIAATTSGTGSVNVTGGVYVGNNIVVASTAASTITNTLNALYVAGGAGVGSLLVTGQAVFQNDVVFSGETTYVYSTNTVYTDNLIELHTPIPGPVWAVDDGKDIGIKFHYYKDAADQSGALVLANDTKWLEWYSTGAEGTSTFVGSAYGTFKTGSIVLANTATSTSTNTGALIVSGGIGLGGALYSGNNISGATVNARNLTDGRVALVGANGQLTDAAGLTYNTLTNILSATISTTNGLAGGAPGSLPYQSNTGTTTFAPIGAIGYVLTSDGNVPVWSPATGGSGGTSDQATTATNIKFGADMQIPYQISAGTTRFKDTFKYDYTLDTLRTVNAAFTGTNVGSSTITGAVTIVGGIGVGGNIYVGGNEVLGGDLAVNGGDITSTATTFNLINENVTAVNFAGSATTLIIGSAGGSTTIRNATTVTNTTNSTSTNTGALVVDGGIGVGGNIYVGGNEVLGGDLAVNGGDITSTATTFNLINENVTAVNFAGSATTLIIGSAGGSTTIRNATTVTNTTNSTSTNTGALVVDGGVGVRSNVYIGGALHVINTGTSTYFHGDVIPVGIVNLGSHDFPFNSLHLNGNTFYLNTVTLKSASGLEFSVESTAGYVTQTVGNLYLNAGVESTGTSTGSLVVTGGAGISGRVNIGNTLTVTGPTILAALDATATTATSLTVNGNATISGIVGITNGSAANTISDGAVRVTGGVSVAKGMVVGEVIVAGAKGAINTGTVVHAFYSNNSLIASFTSNVISSTATVNLDFFDASVYRSAKYLIQVVDGVKVHLSELSIFHDGTSIYLSEYGLITNTGRLGTFNAVLSGNVTLNFTPASGVTAITIKMVRTTITL